MGCLDRRSNWNVGPPSGLGSMIGIGLPVGRTLRPARS